MKANEILKLVTAINEELLKKGYSFKGIETFWNECFKEANKAIQSKQSDINCTKCSEKENIHINYDYNKKELPILNILCNECGNFFEENNSK
jgi:hypothetical protein